MGAVEVVGTSSEGREILAGLMVTDFVALYVL